MTSLGIIDGTMQQQNIEAKRKGYRFCVSCQQAIIEPDAPPYKVQCLTCFKANEPFRFCAECGERLERSRIDYARKNGGKCKLCRYCSHKVLNASNPRWCENCECLHPEFWSCPQAVLV